MMLVPEAGLSVHGARSRSRGIGVLCVKRLSGDDWLASRRVRLDPSTLLRASSLTFVSRSNLTAPWRADRHPQFVSG
jgi:hypothetical protein